MAELNVEIVAVDRNIWSGTQTEVSFTRTTVGEIISCPATFRWWPNWSMTPWCGSSGRRKGPEDRTTAGSVGDRGGRQHLAESAGARVGGRRGRQAGFRIRRLQHRRQGPRQITPSARSTKADERAMIGMVVPVVVLRPFSHRCLWKLRQGERLGSCGTLRGWRRSRLAPRRNPLSWRRSRVLPAFSLRQAGIAQ